MKFGRELNRLFSFWPLHVLGWLCMAVTGVVYSYQGSWTDLSRLITFFLPFAVGFATCIPLRYLYRRLRFHERPLHNSVIMGFLAVFAAANVWLGADLLISLVVRQPPYIRNPMAFQQIYFVNILRRGIPLLGWTFLYLGVKIQREWKRQEERARKANSLAQSGQLQMLRYQLNPHFLFNALNSIRALIDEDEDKAREMITELSEFLRYSLEIKDAAEVPLSQEVEAIRHYLAIQKKRYEDKIRIAIDIDPQAADIPFPSFLIHPLVENAVKYGMHTSPMPLIISLKAHLGEGTLVIDVSNTGRWVEAERGEEPGCIGTGTGLDNVRSRLANAFFGRHVFEVVEKQGRVQVHLEIRHSQRDKA